MRGFATARHEAPALFEAISAQAVRLGLGGFNKQGLSNTVWAFATAGHEAPALLDAITAEALRRGFCGFGEINASNIAWALAVFDTPSARELFRTASFTTRRAHFEASIPLPLTAASVVSLARGAWRAVARSARVVTTGHAATLSSAKKGSRRSSNLMRYEKSARAVSMWRKSTADVSCEVSGHSRVLYRIDALVTLNDGRQVTVEVDGASHFVGRSHEPNGATMLKHRQLRYF